MSDQPIPRVSIAMGVFNCAGTLPAAIDSILSQDYKDWELIICDDKSTDKTLQIAESYAARDPRIRVVQNKKNMGLNHSLNHCLSVARGELYARMDGDDISLESRLRRLVQAVDDHPEIAVISSAVSHFDQAGEWCVRIGKASPVAADFTKGSPFCHAACIMRTSVLRKLGGYGVEPWLKRSQDYQLWFRLYAAGYRGMNLPEVLYKVRDDRAATLRRSLRSRLIEARIMLAGFRMLRLSPLAYLYIARPILLGIMPAWLYDFLRRLFRAN